MFLKINIMQSTSHIIWKLVFLHLLGKVRISEGQRVYKCCEGIKHTQKSFWSLNLSESSAFHLDFRRWVLWNDRDEVRIFSMMFNSVQSIKKNFGLLWSCKKANGINLENYPIDLGLDYDYEEEVKILLRMWISTEKLNFV